PRTGTPSDYAAASPRPAAHPARDPPRRRASRSASARHRPLPAQWPPRQSPARAGRPARPECPRHILPTFSTWLSPLAYNVSTLSVASTDRLIVSRRMSLRTTNDFGRFIRFASSSSHLASAVPNITESLSVISAIRITPL